MKKGKKQININSLNEILKTTIDSIKSSKNDIVEIVIYSNDEYKKLEKELEKIQIEVSEKILETDRIEKKNQKQKIALADRSKNFDKFNEKEIQEAYELANQTRILLLLKREEEKGLLKKRKEIENRLRKTYDLCNKAENINKQISVGMEYLMGNSGNIVETVDKLTQKHYLGIKIIEAQEEERLRVSRDIHDGPAQSLANVILKSELCDKLFDIDKERLKHEIKNLKLIAKDTLRDIRKIIYNLRPMSLDDLGLMPTLDKYIDVFIEDSGIEVVLESYGSFSRLELAIKIVVFRVIQEALNNIKKHSKASYAKIIIEETISRLNILIIDNGIGFNVNHYKPQYSNISSGFGILSIKERVELLNGTFNIASSLNYGTKINILIPLDDDEEDV